MKTFGDYVTFVINCFLIFIILLILYFFVGVIYLIIVDRELYYLAILLVFSGMALIGLQAIISYGFLSVVLQVIFETPFDDRHFTQEKIEDKKLDLWVSAILNIRIFIHKWYIFKLGATLVCMGIILAIVLFLL